MLRIKITCTGKTILKVNHLFNNFVFHFACKEPSTMLKNAVFTKFNFKFSSLKNNKTFPDQAKSQNYLFFSSRIMSRSEKKPRRFLVLSIFCILYCSFLASNCRRPSQRHQHSPSREVVNLSILLMHSSVLF